MSGAAEKLSAVGGGLPMLGRAEILGADDQSSELVEVPEWGGVVRVVSMSGADRAALEAVTRQTRQGGRVVSGAEIEARIVAWTAVDANGARLFDDDDIPQLMQRNGAVVQRVAEAGGRVSGIPMGGPELDEGDAGN